MSNTLPPPGRGLRVGLTIAVAAAAVGFLTGTRGTPERHGYQDERARAPIANVASAPRQADVETTRYAARRAEQATALAAMAKPPRTLTDPVQLNDADYKQAIATRAELRAYDGAPPLIPHAIDQHGAPACLSCHEQGLAVNSKVARPMSHEAFTSCTQCHVTREGPLPVHELLPQRLSEESSFVGLMAQQHGGRAFVASPPQLPHRSFMRERCSSCHGLWANGIATSHPARQSCTQCHALSASSDQMPISTLSSLGQLESVP